MRQWSAYMCDKNSEEDIYKSESQWGSRDGPIATQLAPNLYTASVEHGSITGMIVGEGLAELLGYCAEDMESSVSLWIDIVHPDDVERIRGALSRLLGGQPLFEEYRAFRQDGQLQWVRHSATPVRDDAGEVVRIVGMLQAGGPSEAASDPMARFKEIRELPGTILDSLLSPVAVLNHNGDIFIVNEVWKRFARENGDPTLEHTGVGANCLDVCRRSVESGCEEARLALEGLRDVLSGRIPEFELEYECSPPQGSERWFLMRVAPLLSESGGAVVWHIGITRGRLAEAALRTSEEEFRALVENVDAVVFRADPDLRPITVVGNVGQISGRSAEEFIEHPDLWIDTAHPDDRTRILEFLQSITNERRPGSLEVRGVRPDGEIFWIRAHVTPRFDERGRLVCYEGVYVDITERVEAQQREERRAARVAALAQIGRETANCLDQDRIMNVAVQLAAKALGCVCGIVCVDQATKRPQIESIAADESILTQAAQEVIDQITNALLEITDLESLQDIMLLLPEELASEVRAMAGPSIKALLYAEGSVYGLIASVRCLGGDEFADDDSWFLTEVAANLSNALTNSRLYRRQARIAETLQRSLIPTVREVPDLDIATCYLPAVGEAEVGGDFFDLIDFGDGRVGVIVGDVSGKGMDAAIHTAEAKYMLRGFAVEDPDPGFVIRSLNTALWTYIGEFTYVTLVYGIIDVRKHTIVYVSAGHEPSMILRAQTHDIWEFESSGPALGIVRDWDYQRSQVVLEPGDFLFCYTDGVTDVPGDGARFGHDRLRQTIAQAHPKEPRHLLDHVIRAVREFGHGRQPDDQVILVAGPK